MAEAKQNNTTAASSFSEAAPPFVVYQYNIQSCEGMDKEYHPEKTAEQIMRGSPDVVTLQEVSRFCTTDCYGKPVSASRRKDDQAALLAKLTGMHHHFTCKTKETGGEYGNMVLSRHRILRAESKVLETSAPKYHGSNLFFGPMPQACCAVKIEHPGIGKCWVASVHLGCDASGKEQAAEIQEVFQWVASMAETGECVVIAGDFNAPPFYRCHTLAHNLGLRDAWACCPSTQRFGCLRGPVGYLTGGSTGATAMANNPVNRLDYIYTLGLKPREVRVVDSQVSDHLAVVASFERGDDPARADAALRPLRAGDMLVFDPSRRRAEGAITWSQKLRRYTRTYICFAANSAGTTRGLWVEASRLSALEAACTRREGGALALRVDSRLQYGEVEPGCIDFVVFHDKANHLYQHRFRLVDSPVPVSLSEEALRSFSGVYLKTF